MGMRPPCCDKLKVTKGLWTAEEDAKLLAYVSTHGTGNWTNVPKKAGLKRCGKSCRLRWTNYLRPNLKNEGFTSQEEDLIVTLHATIGSRWSIIANQLPGRTDNDVKNYWNTKLSKKLVHNGIDPVTHRPISEVKESISSLHLAAATTGRRSSGLHDSRIGSINKDLKNILLSRHMPSTSPSSSSSSSTAAHRNTAENAAALPPPLPELEWIEFLSEDAFLCFEEQDAYNCPTLCATSDSSSTGDVGNEFMSSVLRSAASTTSFVQAILDRDREMISDYSGLLSDHYDLF